MLVGRKTKGHVFAMKNLDLNFIFMSMGVLPSRMPVHYIPAVSIETRRGCQIPQIWNYRQLGDVGTCKNSKAILAAEPSPQLLEPRD